MSGSAYLNFKVFSLVCLLLFANSIFAQNQKPEKSSGKKPNIILIMTDQHQAAALSVAGNLDVRTPNLDKLAKNGLMFDRAYVTFPLCSPSRSSIFTGKMPHVLGVKSNEKGSNEMMATDKKNGLGNVLSSAGYHCAYGGKWHAHEAAMAEGNGFEKIAEFGDISLAEKCISYLSQRKDNKQPFFLVASFDNPHNICEWARNQPLPYGNVTVPANAKLPELPKNFAKTATFPEALQIEQTADKRSYPTANYNTTDWRKYRYTYYRLVEQVDAEIGKIIDAIDELGLRDNTVIIFTSDHGDGNAAHNWNQKTALFEESVRVPFIVSAIGVQNKGGVDLSSLVSNGLDLFPTICDFAGITPPEKLAGKSLKPLLEGNTNLSNIDFVVIETKFDGNFSYKTMGRAIIGNRYKYIIYDWGKHREQFFDLKNDPLETNNLIEDKNYLKELDKSRQALYDWCKETNDKLFLRKLVLPTTSKLTSSDLFDTSY